MLVGDVTAACTMQPSRLMFLGSSCSLRNHRCCPRANNRSRPQETLRDTESGRRCCAELLKSLPHLRHCCSVVIAAATAASLRLLRRCCISRTRRQLLRSAPLLRFRRCCVVAFAAAQLAARGAPNQFEFSFKSRNMKFEFTNCTS